MKTVSNKEISRACTKLRENPKDIQPYNKINAWRALHATPLVRFRTNLHIYKKERKKWMMVSQRLKRMPTIVSKISRFPKMQLHRMQDIGGIRAVVENMSELRALQKNFVNKKSSFSFKLVKETDYTQNRPIKDTGYRGLHHIYKYKQQSDGNDLSIEFQIRTKLQHLWANAIETVDIIEEDDDKLKFGQISYNNKEKNEIFSLISSLFSLVEKTKTLKEHENKDQITIIEEINKKEKSIHILDKLNRLIQITESTNIKVSKNTKYCIIKSNIETKQTEIKEYSEENFEEANNEYIEIEKKALESGDANKIIAVLVSADKVRESYRGYFFDTRDFLNEIKQLGVIF